MLSYVDETSVGICTEEEHLQSLYEILTLLYVNGVRLKLSNSSFGVLEREILRHKLSPLEVSLPDGHVRATRNLVEPA